MKVAQTHIQLNTAHEGWFKMRAYRVDQDGVEIESSSRELTPWFKNLITNQGLDYMAVNSGWRRYCQVGTGSTMPANSDTQLVARVAGVEVRNSPGPTHGAAGEPDYYVYTRLVYTFAAGAAAGNLAEVGIGWNTTGATLFSRALILDLGGSPTTITVLSDEVLEVTYEFRTYPPLVDVTGTVNLSGTNYGYTLRACRAGTVGSSSAPGWGYDAQANGGGSAAGAQLSASLTFPSAGGLTALTTNPPAANQGNATSFAQAAYTNGNYYRDATLVCATDKWNGVAGGIRTLVYSFQWGCYQVEFNPPLPKDNTKSLSLVLRQSWARRSIP